MSYDHSFYRLQILISVIDRHMDGLRQVAGRFYLSWNENHILMETVEVTPQ